MVIDEDGRIIHGHISIQEHLMMESIDVELVIIWGILLQMV